MKTNARTSGIVAGVLSACLLVSARAGGEMASERWGPAGGACTHPGTLKVVREADRTRLVFDISRLPKGAQVHRARLLCFTRDGRQPTEPARIIPAGGSDRALVLQGPWYQSFDVSECVRAAAGAGEVAFLVERFDGLAADKTCLEIAYEGKGGEVPEQVAGVRALHHDGQTFLVFAEHPAFRPPPESVVYVEKFSRRGNEVVKEPGSGWRGLARVPAITLATLRQLQGMELRDQPSGFQGIREAKRVRKVPEVRYRVYRHTERITPGNIHLAECVGEAEPLNAYDQKMAVVDFKGEYIDQREVGGSIIPTSCVEDGKPVSAGEAIYVHDVEKPGKSYYAVTTVLDGTENARDVTAANSLSEPVEETVQPRKPVLQRLQDIQPGAGVLERWYLFWAGPPYANLPGKALHVLIGEPEKAEPPLAMVVDGFHGGFNIVGALRVPAGGALTLLIEYQIGYGGDGDVLHNEGLGTLRSYRECKVRDFSERYFLRMIEWARGTWKVDPARIYGGQHDSGPLHLGVRHPEIFGRVFVGNYTASYDYKWSPPSQGLPTVLGPKDLAKTPDGKSAWDALDLGWYLRQDPGKDVPFIWGGSNTGKDSGHTSEFGWQDDPRGWAALEAARQPFAVAWGVGQADPWGSRHLQGMSPELASLISSRRWDKTIPAFSRCSLDDNPGNGDPADGDACGQINAYLVWSDDDSADEPGEWEVTIWLAATAPRDRCAVDLTPRHCRKFKPQKGEKFQWTNKSLADGQVVGSGTVAADEWGLVTLTGLKVGKGKNRISIQRQ